MSQKITVVPRLTQQPFEYELPDGVDPKVIGAVVRQAFEDGAEHASTTIMNSLLAKDDPYNRSAD